MAVTFLQQPQAFTPSDNPIMFVFESDNTALPNFEFLVEVYKWNSTIANSIKLSTHRIFPTLGNQAYFDASETISAFLKAAKIPSDTEVVFDAENWDNFAIVVNERFGDFSNTSIFATSTPFVSWKSCLSDIDFENYSYMPFRSFLTDRPQVNFSERALAYFYNEGTGITDVRLEVYDNQDNLVDSKTISIPNKGVYGINMKAEIWNSIEGIDINGAFLLQAITINNGDELSFFDLYVNLPYFPFQPPLAIPQSFGSCYPLERKNTLFFLNKLGGYDAFVFAQNFKKRKQTQRNTMEKSYGRQSVNAYTFANSQRKTNYFNNTSFDETLQTNWLSEATHNRLIDKLIESPLVFRFDENGNKEFLQVTDNSSEYKYRDYETLFQLSVNIETSKYSKSARL
jgi:hypothetical protein